MNLAGERVWNALNQGAPGAFEEIAAFESPAQRLEARAAAKAPVVAKAGGLDAAIFVPVDCGGLEETGTCSAANLA